MWPEEEQSQQTESSHGSSQCARVSEGMPTSVCLALSVFFTGTGHASYMPAPSTPYPIALLTILMYSWKFQSTWGSSTADVLLPHELHQARTKRRDN